MIRLTDFEKKTPDPVLVSYVSTASGDIPVYEIKSFHSLTQLIGFGKYLNKGECNVYLRGQTSLYEGLMTPSVLRPKKNKKNEKVFKVENLKINIKLLPLLIGKLNVFFVL